MGIEWRGERGACCRRPLRRVRLAVLARRSAPPNGQNSQHLTAASAVRRDDADHDHTPPILIWQAGEVGTHGEVPVHHHEVSGAGWQTKGLGITSTTCMLPRRQCGQIRKDTPVNASCRSR